MLIGHKGLSIYMLDTSMDWSKWICCHDFKKFRILHL